MKSVVLALLVIQTIGPNQILKTQKFGGSYAYGKDLEKGRIGNLSIYPETDSTVLFYLDLNRGAPSYNMGNLYGRIKILNSSGIFYLTGNGADCKFNLSFSKDFANIKTLEEKSNCFFGYAVYADGNFKRRSKQIPQYFQSPTGDTTYFGKVSPEEYNKE